ncbi:MAG: hypothetical protein LBH62_08640 [Nitrososphaerota archaeon]|jgi:hypothetical protein|nr:hypothetical protein [Nitrososphaerota archaeon]
MKTKRISVLIAAVAMLCVVAVSGFASAANISSASFTPFSGGAIVNIGNVTGPQDGKYATTSGGGGQLICSLSATIAAKTTITIHTYGKDGDLYAYAKNAAGTWVQIGAWTLQGNTNYKTYTCSADFATNSILLATIPSGSLTGNIDAATTP